MLEINANAVAAPPGAADILREIGRRQMTVLGSLPRIDHCANHYRTAIRLIHS